MLKPDQTFYSEYNFATNSFRVWSLDGWIDETFEENIIFSLLSKETQELIEHEPYGYPFEYGFTDWLIYHYGSSSDNPYNIHKEIVVYDRNGKKHAWKYDEVLNIKNPHANLNLILADCLEDYYSFMELKRTPTKPKLFKTI